MTFSFTVSKDSMIYASVLALFALFILFVYFRAHSPTPAVTEDTKVLTINHNNGFSTVIVCAEGRDLSQPINPAEGKGIGECLHDHLGFLHVQTSTLTPAAQ